MKEEKRQEKYEKIKNYILDSKSIGQGAFSKVYKGKLIKDSLK